MWEVIEILFFLINKIIKLQICSYNIKIKYNILFNVIDNIFKKLVKMLNYIINFGLKSNL